MLEGCEEVNTRASALQLSPYSESCSKFLCYSFKFLICLLVISLKTLTFELIALQTIICSFFLS